MPSSNPTAYWICNCRHPQTKVWYADAVADAERRAIEAEANRDEWQREAVTTREARSHETYEAIKDRITDELDKKAGAGAALSVAVALTACAEDGKHGAERERDEDRKRLKDFCEKRISAVDAVRRETGSVQAHDVADGEVHAYQELYAELQKLATLADSDPPEEPCDRCNGECMVSPTDACPNCGGSGDQRPGDRAVIEMVEALRAIAARLPNPDDPSGEYAPSAAARINRIADALDRLAAQDTPKEETK